LLFGAKILGSVRCSYEAHPLPRDPLPACCRSADADDQQKAQKQLGRVNAMASDTTGRRVVSITMSDMLNMKRSDLVKLRKNLNLSYGSAFIAHQLIINGVDLGLIVSQLNPVERS
jgi:hypothetical protein